MAQLPYISHVFTVASKPEVRYTPSGKGVTNIFVVANGYSKDKDNTPALWINVTWWIPPYDWATRLAESIDKGQRVHLSGRMHTEQWRTRDGENRSKTVLVLDEAPTVIPREDRPAGTSSGTHQGSDTWGSNPGFGNADDNPPF